MVVVRGIISICCHKEEDEFTQAELRRQEEEAKKLRLLGQNPDGGADKEGDFMSEAKDWAGELISGQTGTGRILVRQEKFNTYSAKSCTVSPKANCLFSTICPHEE